MGQALAPNVVKELDRSRPFYHCTLAVVMSILPSINSHILESLYGEAVVLADELRSRFDDLRVTLDTVALVTGGYAHLDCDDGAHLAISCEALRVTNRMTHCMTWLLNHRAYLRGELSALQLRRQGRILDTGQNTDKRVLLQLPAELQRTIAATNALYERIARLDKAWRLQDRVSGTPSSIESLRERITARLQVSAG